MDIYRCFVYIDAGSLTLTADYSLEKNSWNAVEAHIKKKGDSWRVVGPVEEEKMPPGKLNNWKAKLDTNGLQGPQKL